MYFPGKCPGYAGDRQGGLLLNISTLVEQMKLENLTPEIDLTALPEIKRGYVSDLLSDVLGNAPAGGILVTVQVHLNVVAVAVHAELTAIIFALGRKPDETTRDRALQERVVLLASEEPAFDIVGKLYALDIRGAAPCV